MTEKPDISPQSIVLIIADDLTGAADTGVELSELGGVFVAGMEKLEEVLCTERYSILAVNTATRNAGEDEVKGKLLSLGRQLDKLSVGLVFKKIDSCLRGLPGLEISILLKLLKLKGALVVPALPYHGRITEGGVHKLRGIPLAESEMSNDPLYPMTESRPDVILGKQSGAKTTHVALHVVRRGVEHLAKYVDTLLARDVSVISFDAVLQSDLDILAQLAVLKRKDTLIAASSGLARSLGEIFGHSGRVCLSPAKKEKFLFVCGSASTVMEKQISSLVQETDFQELVCHPKVYNHNLPLHGGRNKVLRLPYLSQEKLASDGACSALCEFACELSAVGEYDCLFVSGGDTADLFLHEVSARGFSVKGSLQPGVPWGYIHGGNLDGTCIVCKAGSFGEESLLQNIYYKLKGGNYYG